MKYPVSQFHRDFPNDAACLEYIFRQVCPDHTDYHRLRGRPAYVNKKGNQIYPLVGTIFEKSSTPLRTWFYAIYLFSQSKNGVSAAELSRQTGVTYKCAWRIANRIRGLMKQEKLMLCGTVEADETYIGATKSLGCWAKPHVPIVGMVQRKGKVIAKVLPNFKEENIVTFVQNSLRKGSTLYTDGAPVYNICQGYKRGVVIHSKKEYVRGDIHTNTIEGFWSHLKRPLRGTYASVSRKYLQSYVDERVFTWNNRQDAFEKLLAKI